MYMVQKTKNIVNERAYKQMIIYNKQTVLVRIYVYPLQNFVKYSDTECIKINQYSV